MSTEKTAEQTIAARAAEFLKDVVNDGGVVTPAVVSLAANLARVDCALGSLIPAVGILLDLSKEQADKIEALERKVNQ